MAKITILPLDLLPLIFFYSQVVWLPILYLRKRIFSRRLLPRKYTCTWVWMINAFIFKQSYLLPEGIVSLEFRLFLFSGYAISSGNFWSQKSTGKWWCDFKIIFPFPWLVKRLWRIHSFIYLFWSSQNLLEVHREETTCVEKWVRGP